MSNYINVLRRLERERRMPTTIVPSVAPSETGETAAAPASTRAPETPASPPPTPTARTVIPLPTAAAHPASAASTAAPQPAVRPLDGALPIPTVPPPPAARTLDSRRAQAFAPAPHPGIATLLDNIRMLSGARARRIIVFCGASTAEAVTTLAGDLASHAGRRGMKAVVGALLRTPTGSVVAPAHNTVDASTMLKVDLDAGPSGDALNDWAERIAPANDLVVITGPPLANSIDAALLACACDGLVIVAESEITDRKALHIAAERARIAGCRTLGVVMHGTKDHLPKWIRRIVGDPAETHVRED